MNAEVVTCSQALDFLKAGGAKGARIFSECGYSQFVPIDCESKFLNHVSALAIALEEYGERPGFFVVKAKGRSFVIYLKHIDSELFSASDVDYFEIEYATKKIGSKLAP